MGHRQDIPSQPSTLVHRTILGWPEWSLTSHRIGTDLRVDHRSVLPGLVDLVVVVLGMVELGLVHRIERWLVG